MKRRRLGICSSSMRGNVAARKEFARRHLPAVLAGVGANRRELVLQIRLENSLHTPPQEQIRGDQPAVAERRVGKPSRLMCGIGFLAMEAGRALPEFVEFCFGEKELRMPGEVANQGVEQERRDAIFFQAIPDVTQVVARQYLEVGRGPRRPPRQRLAG